MTTDSGCILVVCGLPASGKSSLVHQIHLDLVDEFQVIIIEYDHLLPGDFEKKLIRETSSQDASKWKLYREQIVECVDLLFENHNRSSAATREIFSNSSKPLLVDDDLWMKFRDYEALIQNEVPGVVCRPFVIIIDDNMYYRSMRHEYFQLARKHTVGFCELYLECTTEAAISRNALRVMGQVQQDVIPSMAAHFEKPNSEACHWEKHSLKIACPTVSDIKCLITRAIEDPVQPVPVEDLEQKTESRQICSASVIHQADQILRKLVTQEMTAAKDSGMSADKLRQKAAEMAEHRSRILKDLKSGVVTVTTNVEDASKDSNSELHKLITSIFCSTKMPFENG